MLLNQKIEMRWNPKNKNYYLQFGCYQYTKMQDIFYVDIAHLKEGSKELVWVKCDYCSEPFQRTYNSHVMLNKKQKDINDKDCCDKEVCVKKKIIETNNIKYGVDYAKQNQEVQQMLEDRLEEKYGVRNVFQLEEVKERSKETCLEKYGALNYQQSEEGKENFKNFCLERYGVENPFQSPEIVEKIKNTNIKKYGVSQLMKLPDVKEKRALKRAQTVYKNGSGISTSRQQRYLSYLLNGELNYPEGKINMDVAFPEEKIYIEYHGSGHWLSVQFGNLTLEQFNKRERDRQYFLKSTQWKLIRIISFENDYLPSDEKVIEMINYCKSILSTGRSWIELNIDESKIKYRGNEIAIDLGALRRIREIDLIEQNSLAGSI